MAGAEDRPVMFNHGFLLQVSATKNGRNLPVCRSAGHGDP
jgi:hypothetical protein